MNLELSTEQLSIAKTAAEYLGKELSESRIRELADGEGPSLDDANWLRCAKLGWLGLGLPEEFGGVGFGLAEEVMLFREFGRHLTPGPFLSSGLGARAAAAAGDGELARKIASGQLRVGMLVAGADSSAPARSAPGSLVIDGDRGDLALALFDHGAELAHVEDLDPVPGIDPCVRTGRATLGPVVARAEGGDLLDRARVMLAAQLLGIVEAVRDLTAEYARTRTQFGTPIGAFQAVKHRSADMAVAAYATVGQVFQAALLVDAHAEDARFHAANAYVLATIGATSSVTDTIQNHGGIGFTWEHQAHLYVKRTLVLERLLGPPRETYAAIVAPSRHVFG
jgi:alkylation response protein AidB-like acyl-CoA dehydrogenase